MRGTKETWCVCRKLIRLVFSLSLLIAVPKSYYCGPVLLLPLQVCFKIKSAKDFERPT